MPPSRFGLMLNPSMLATADLPMMFTLFSSGNIAISPGNGRGGGSSIRCTFVNSTKVGCLSPVSIGTNGPILNCVFRPTALPVNGSVAFAELLDGTTTQVSFAINPHGQIEAWRGVMGADILFGVSSARIIPNQQSHLELRAVTNVSTGSVTAWLNERQVLSVTNLNTIPSGVAVGTAVFIGCYGGVEPGGFYDFSDISFINSTMGERKILLFDPNAPGALSDFLPVGSAANYSAVNEPLQNGDTSYVSDSIVGHHDSYSFSDLPANASIVGIGLHGFVRKTDTATKQFRALYRISGTNYLGLTYALTQSYSVFLDDKVNNPATAVPWTVADVNALEAGREITV
jgi:hypothetical protein